MHDLTRVRLARALLGPTIKIRADANMWWSLGQALEMVPKVAKLGSCFEQPVQSGDLDAMAQLTRMPGMMIIADGSFSDRASLARLMQNRACSGVNVRICKYGGLRASIRRCWQALDAGLALQVGCPVGESSLLSAAQLALLACVQQVRYAEGCFGRYLLRFDPLRPVLQFGYGGRAPKVPAGPGLGVQVDEGLLRRYASQVVKVR